MEETFVQTLTIAGSDSGGGAGIQADLKTFQMRGVFGTSVITAVTAQNTLGVSAVHLVPTETITAQIQAIREDFDIRSYKIGMLGTAEIIECVADNLKHCSFGRRVLDPVMIAKGGAPLLQDSAVAALTRRLLDLDADPVGIDHHLAAAVPQPAPLVAQRPGVRLPGTANITEALMWAIVGQQITTAQARDQITRATDLAGQALPEGLRTGSVTRLPVLPADAARTADAWFRGPGARRRALVAALTVDIDTGQPIDTLRAQLLALPGVGPWTADYVLLRAARATDSHPARDVALLGAARDLGIADDHGSLFAALQAASPWRSYASLHLWLHNSTLRPPPRRRRSAAPPVKDAP